jgi:hypothetical protein
MIFGLVDKLYGRGELCTIIMKAITGLNGGDLE